MPGVVNSRLTPTLPAFGNEHPCLDLICKQSRKLCVSTGREMEIFLKRQSPALPKRLRPDCRGDVTQMQASRGLLQDIE